MSASIEASSSARALERAFHLRGGEGGVGRGEDARQERAREVDDREGAIVVGTGGRGARTHLSAEWAVRELGAADVALRERVVLRDAHERPRARGGRRRHPAATREVVNAEREQANTKQCKCSRGLPLLVAGSKPLETTRSAL